MNTFRSFDGIQIAYHDEGKGPAVILLHGGYLDGLGQFGDFERILPLAQRRQEMFREVFGGALPLPNPPIEGRPGLVRALLAAGARTILPDMRGFGASDKPREKASYENSAMARDVVSLIDHLRLDTVDVIGFSMGAGTAARLLLLHPPQLKSAILAGFGDYAIEDHVMEFPKNWPVPDSVPRPITARVWLEEGAKILEKGGNGSRTPRLGEPHRGSDHGNRSEGDGRCHSWCTHGESACRGASASQHTGSDT
jgi:pimeloyl-ACP methyl ester carboxylesterase